MMREETSGERETTGREPERFSGVNVDEIEKEEKNEGDERDLIDERRVRLWRLEKEPWSQKD